MATEDVYFATESGKILEINFAKNAFFRDSTLYSLLVKAPQSYARINRVRQMAGKKETRALINQDPNITANNRSNSVLTPAEIASQ